MKTAHIIILIFMFICGFYFLSNNTDEKIKSLEQKNEKLNIELKELFQKNDSIRLEMVNYQKEIDSLKYIDKKLSLEYTENKKQYKYSN